MAITDGVIVRVSVNRETLLSPNNYYKKYSMYQVNQDFAQTNLDKAKWDPDALVQVFVH